MRIGDKIPFYNGMTNKYMPDKNLLAIRRVNIVILFVLKSDAYWWQDPVLQRDDGFCKIRPILARKKQKMADFWGFAAIFCAKKHCFLLYFVVCAIIRRTFSDFQRSAFCTCDKIKYNVIIIITRKEIC